VGQRRKYADRRPPILPATPPQQRIGGHAAFTGEEALEKVKDCSPDLIILDIRMPSMNGYEFMRALRAMRIIEEKKMLPVIMLTATEAMEDVFKLEGAKGYLIKPVNEELLFQKIKGCLGPND
jgi:CheY-like chemotaxis protein